jgi:hypothetical protein
MEPAEHRIEPRKADQRFGMRPEKLVYVERRGREAAVMVAYCARKVVSRIVYDNFGFSSHKVICGMTSTHKQVCVFSYGKS